MNSAFKKKIGILFSMLCFLGIVVLSLSLPVYSQTKRSSSSVRKASSSAVRKSSSTARKPSTSNTKRAATSSTRRVASSSSRARSLSSSGRVRSASSRTSTSRARVNARTPIGRGLSFMNQLSDNATSADLECIDSYVACMDEQINPLLSKFSFFEEDEAVNEVLDTGQAFRCIFYDTNSSVLKSNISPMQDDKMTCIGLTDDTCYTQRGPNELYNAYNYFCSINRTLKNSIGRKVNQCDLETSNSFATKYSSAYYNEVLKRIEGDGLQIINLESSTIYKNFINQLNLSNESSYVLDPDISNEIFNDLNLENNQELFSVNVLPPIGVNTFLPSSQFLTASNKCFSTETTSDKEVNTRINKMKNNNCVAMRPKLERYYLTGKWEGAVLDENGNKVEDAQAKDVMSGFFSAKESCGLYEQALISVRDKKYGEFDNQMQNWIEENLAKIIEKKIKSTSSMVNAETELKNLDYSISLDNEKLQNEIEFNKMKAQNDLELAKTNYEMAVSNATIENATAQQQIAALYAKTFSSKALKACNKMIQNSYNRICGSNGSKCFSRNSGLSTTYYSWTEDINKKAIKISKTGSILLSDGSNYNTKDSTDGYYEIDCVNIEDFNYKQSFLYNLPGSLLSSYGVSVRDAVSEDLKNTFPEN